MAWIGVDISKLTFDATFIANNIKKNIHHVFTNNDSGFKEFVDWILKIEMKDPHICIESTGVYGQDFCFDMYVRGYRISIVNPYLIKAFAGSENIRNKTDKIDSGVIARFCKTHHPRLWTPSGNKQDELRSLYRCLQDLQADRTRLSNRIEGCSKRHQKVIETLQESVKHIEEQIKIVESYIKDVIDEDHDLKKDKDLLQTIKGIGDKTAIAVLSELPDIQHFKNIREVTAFFGLSPQSRESGSSVKSRGRLSKRGCSTLRKALFLPAIVSKKHNPILKAFAERLAKSGKSKMTVICAVMRKLLHIIYGVLKHQKPFDLTCGGGKNCGSLS